MEEVLKKIMGGVLHKGPNRAAMRLEYKKLFTSRYFVDEYHIFGLLMEDFSNLNISERFLELWVRNNRAVIEQLPQINWVRYSGGEEEDKFQVFLTSLMQVYKECAGTEVELEDYLECLVTYKDYYINTEALKIWETCATMLTEGVKIKGKLWVGFEDAQTYNKIQMKALTDLTTNAERKGLIIYGVNDAGEEGVEDKIEKICDYGFPSVDRATKGIYEHDMISLLAPSKGGKSRICTNIVHNAIISGVNVCAWSIENGYKGWESLLRARHFEYFYNSNTTNLADKRYVTDDDIKKSLLDAETRELELMSFEDLKTNKSYGQIVNVDEDFDPDTVFEVMDEARALGCRLFCIDYLQLVSAAKGMGKNERIAALYQSMLQYANKYKVAILCPGQIKQVALGTLSKADDLSTLELRDIAGESYEVFKTPSVNILLYATQEELQQGRVTWVPLPSRTTAQYPPVKLDCEMGTCTFVEVTS